MATKSETISPIEEEMSKSNPVYQMYEHLNERMSTLEHKVDDFIKQMKLINSNFNKISSILAKLELLDSLNGKEK